MPEYLIPSSMRGVANTSREPRKKRRKIFGSSQQRIEMSKMRDPLRNFGQTTSEGGSSGGSGGSGEVKESERIFTAGEVSGSLGKGISGRKQWKIKHRKGEHNPKLVKRFSNVLAGSFNMKKFKATKK